MKSYIFLICTFFLITIGSGLQGQTIHIVTNTADWESGASCAGPWGNPVFNIGPCANNCVMECLCTGAVDLTINTCEDATPIWVIPPPANCFYPAATFYFRTHFFLDADACEIQNANMTWQADNNSSVWINPANPNNVCGVPADYIQSGFNTPAMATVTNNLVPGDNVIVVRVSNNVASTCPNWAFLSLCLDITIVPMEEVDASFGLFAGPGTIGDYTLYPDDYNLYSGQNAQHEWYILTSETSCPPNPADYEAVGVIPDDFVTIQAFDEVHYTIIHRVITECGTACYGQNICRNCEDTRENDAVCWLTGEIDCDILGKWDFPVIGLDGGGGTRYRASEKLQPSIEKNNIDLNLFPNPTDGKVNLSWSKPGYTTIKVYDILGKLVMTSSVDATATKVELDANQLNPDLYLLELSNEKGESLVKKLELIR